MRKFREEQHGGPRIAAFGANHGHASCFRTRIELHRDRL